jgi:sulfate adenylyltransferase
VLPAPDSAPQFAPSARELDDLDLLASGALAPLVGFGPPTTGVTLRVPAEVAAKAVASGALELIDPEGAPLAVVTVESTYDDDAPLVGVVGSVRGTHRREGRVFDRLHLSPAELRAELDAQALVVPCEGPLSDQDVVHVAQAAAGRPVVLLALCGEGRPQGLSGVGLVRASVAAAGLIPGARVVAVPLARRSDVAADAELRSRVVRAYAGPAEVLQVTGQGRHPEAVEAVLRSDRPSGAEQGMVVFFTGLSGSGKSTVARALRDRLVEDGQRTVSLLDGDVVRRNLSAGLTFSREDRETNIRRIGWVAAEISRHGGTAICSPIAPFAGTRAAVREMVESAGGAFVLVHVATPLQECERRDRKGLYAKARRDAIPDFTGISSPYEEPQDADLRVDTTGRSVEEVVGEVLALLRRRGLVELEVRAGDAP